MDAKRRASPRPSDARLEAIRARSPGATSISRNDTSAATALKKPRSGSDRRSLLSSTSPATSKAHAAIAAVSLVKSGLPNLGTSNVKERPMPSSNASLRRPSVLCTRTTSSAARLASNFGRVSRTSLSTARRCSVAKAEFEVNAAAAAASIRPKSASHGLMMMGPACPASGMAATALLPSALDDRLLPPAAPEVRGTPARPLAALLCAC
mmetsp:Transcript_43929/g.87129  ORF Transcript_43929/g.87129 Transcript_43929/m.87129 type:complete len:209 (-) Transcript_43929:1450-2076(-)